MKWRENWSELIVVFLYPPPVEKIWSKIKNIKVTPNWLKLREKKSQLFFEKNQSCSKLAEMARKLVVNYFGFFTQPWWKTTSMADNLNWRQPKWKTTSIDDDHNGRRPHWKTTSMEDNLYGRQPQWKTTFMEDNLNGRQPLWKTTSMEDNLNGRQP